MGISSLAYVESDNVVNIYLHQIVLSSIGWQRVWVIVKVINITCHTMSAFSKQFVLVDPHQNMSMTPHTTGHCKNLAQHSTSCSYDARCK